MRAALIKLKSELMSKLEAKGLKKLYNEIELPLIDVLYDMERIGFTVDRNTLSTMSKELNARITSLEADILRIRRGKVQYTFHKAAWHGSVEKLGLPPAKKTKTGYSTDSEVLEGLYDSIR